MKCGLEGSAVYHIDYRRVTGGQVPQRSIRTMRALTPRFRSHCLRGLTSAAVAPHTRTKMTPAEKIVYKE